MTETPIKRLLLGSTMLGAMAMISVGMSTPAAAQQPAGQPPAAQQGAEDQVIEEVVVTGSYIRRRTEAGVGAPIAVIGRDDMAQAGATTVADLIQTLTFNTGSQNNPDAFTQNLTTGTENFNLRGLGVASTLVLLNGKRQVVASTPTDDGVLFVDTASLVPSIAIGRLEIVKDGAAALYGSDAVGGVVNFITRNNFEGLELEGEFKAVTDQGSSSDVRIEGIAGTSFDDARGHAVMAISYLDRTALTTQERRLSPKFGPDVSAIGQPGTFVPAFLLLLQSGQLPLAAVPQQLGAILSSPGAASAIDAGINKLALGMPPDSAGVRDPDCPKTPVADGPFSNSLAATTPTGLQVCILDFGDAFNLVPETTRLQGYANVTYQISDAIEFYGEFGFARNRTKRNNSPTFPILNTNVFGGPAANSLIGAPPNPFNPFNVDLFGLVRPIGFGPFPKSEHNSDTFRGVAGLRGDLSRSWTYDFSIMRGSNDFDVMARDTLADRFFAALNGFGGPNCPLGGVGAVRGQGDCMFFNPFGSANKASPGDTVIDPLTGLPVPVANSPEVINDFLALSRQSLTSRLWTVDLVLSGDLGDSLALPGGPIGVALGGQFRHEGFALDADENLNSGNFLFLSGAGTRVGDFSDSRDTWAGFVEVSFPIASWWDITAAGRFENTQNITSTLDPKFSSAMQVMDGLQIRSSYSTSFRAPSIFQQRSKGGVTLLQVNDPFLGNTGFVGGFTLGNENLKPEESDQFNVGFTYEVSPDLTIDLDYWNFHFKDVIVKENAQALLDAAGEIFRTTGNPAALFNPARFFRATGVPLLTQVNVQFVNAPSIKTDGIDFKMVYTKETDIGVFRPYFEGTLILGYTVEDPTLGITIDGKGSRNFRNIGDPTPPLRFNAGLSWSRGAHSLLGVARFIDGFDDDQISPTGNGFEENGRVDQQLTFDVQYSVELGEVFDFGTTEHVTLTAGVINLTDEKPPFVNTNSGFEARVHDPRGRLAYVRLNIGF